MRTLPKEFAPFFSEKITPLQGHLFIVMPFIRGVTLRQHLTARVALNSSMTQREVASWTLSLVHFCYFAHEYLKLSHNDLKLGNVMVEGGSALRVIDLTFSTRSDVVNDGGDAEVTWQRGTLAFMPPEKLFFQTPPPHAAAACGGDMWAIGTIMASMALTSTCFAFSSSSSFASRMDEIFDAFRFDPSYTDTVYHLLASSTPWFSTIVSRMTASCKGALDRIWIEQGVRLLLWTRALIFKGDSQGKTSFSLPGNEYMTGIEQTPLHRVLDQHSDAILQMYDHDGFFVFEAAYKTLAARLGPDLLGIYLTTQVWNPLQRGGGSTHHPNPFHSVARRLEQLSGEERQRIVNNLRLPLPVPCEGRSPINVHLSLEDLLHVIQTRPCRQCKGAVMVAVDGKKAGYLYCSDACKAWDEQFY
jgi:serine/threonine protein kinase